MNRKQVAFIICSNDEIYYDQCVRYIGELEVPEGYSIEILGIWEADSMAAGYNAGMQESDAKYKVYLHQDTFLLNTRFLYDIVNVFESDEMIGMLGVVGITGLSKEGKYDLGWNMGGVDTYNGRTCLQLRYSQTPEYAYREADAVDGLIMVTQYDVPWREELLDGWDCCDISQSLEMRKRGYKVVVPYQQEAWCFHDCGVRHRSSQDTYRNKIQSEYPEYFVPSGSEAAKEVADETEMSGIEEVRRNLILLLEQNEYEKLSEITEEVRNIWPLDTQIREIANIMEIFDLEKRNVNGVHSQLFLLSAWEEMYHYYKWLHLVLMRMGHGREDERIKELTDGVRQGRISADAVWKMANATLKNTSPIYEMLCEERRGENAECPLVSVIVSVYNGASIIEETLNSVLNQTYRKIEVIVIDDASTDNSREVISSYQDSRIQKVFLEKNRHICYAGNVGFKMAKGKYVALIGHDDIWKPDKLEKQVAFLEEHPAHSVCFSWADIVDEGGNVINDRWKCLYDIFCGDNHSQDYWIRQLILGGNQFCAPSACIRRDCLERTGYYRYGLVQLQDYDLWLRLMKEGPVYVLQEKLVLYRRFVGSDKNVSAVNQKTQNRDRHEIQWIHDTYLHEMTEEDFARVFSQELINPGAEEKWELRWEKAMLLWKMGNVFFVKRFIELLENDECREIMEEKYQFDLKDFYEMNTGTVVMDHSLVETVLEQQRVIYQQQEQKRMTTE